MLVDRQIKFISRAMRGSLFDVLGGLLVAVRARRTFVIGIFFMLRLALLRLLHVMKDICRLDVRHGSEDKPAAGGTPNAVSKLQKRHKLTRAV